MAGHPFRLFIFFPLLVDNLEEEPVRVNAGVLRIIPGKQSEYQRKIRNNIPDKARAANPIAIKIRIFVVCNS